MKINAVTFTNNVFTDVTFPTNVFHLRMYSLKPQSVLVIHLSLQKRCRF